MDGVARLIDLNNERLNYSGDHEAFLNVLLTLKDKAERGVHKSRIGELGAWLRAGMDYLGILEEMEGW
jgi:hypothetical protein